MKNNRVSLRYLDFWLMGGASLVVWAVLMATQPLRYDYPSVDQRFQQLAIAFAFLSLVCNHPHFMASYALAYGRERSFWRRHWVALVGVPAVLILVFGFAFVFFDRPADGAWSEFLNAGLERAHLSYRFGASANFGMEMLGLAAWLMYFTVGWHYAKQVFGCMMVYANYDGYQLTSGHRTRIKLALFGVAFYNFCHLNFHWHEYFGSSFSLMGVPLQEIGLPAILEPLATTGLLIGLAAFGYLIWDNHRRYNRWPSANFCVLFLSFYVWWAPLLPQKEFYFILVPFFHSLQYLAFAYRMDKKRPGNQRVGAERRHTVRILVLLVVGFLAFEAVPGWLDTKLSSGFGQFPVFFVVAFALFINIHHYFLDSVLWRSSDPRMRDALLSAHDERRRA